MFSSRFPKNRQIGEIENGLPIFSVEVVATVTAMQRVILWNVEKLKDFLSGAAGGAIA